MTTENKEAEAIDYVFSNMEYDYSEIEEELKEAIKLTLIFKEKEMLDDEITLIDRIEDFTNRDLNYFRKEIQKRLQKLKGDNDEK